MVFSPVSQMSRWWVVASVRKLERFVCVSSRVVKVWFACKAIGGKSPTKDKTCTHKRQADNGSPLSLSESRIERREPCNLYICVVNRLWQLALSRTFSIAVFPRLCRTFRKARSTKSFRRVLDLCILQTKREEAKSYTPFLIVRRGYVSPCVVKAEKRRSTREGVCGL